MTSWNVQAAAKKTTTNASEKIIGLWCLSSTALKVAILSLLANRSGALATYQYLAQVRIRSILGCT
jgi:hypothetical protein